MITGVIPTSAGYFGAYGDASIIAARRVNTAEISKEKADFAVSLHKETELKCPYSYRARNGIIEYNGVIFTCDYENNALCLGDMSNPDKVLRISLPSGGSLNLNVDNIGSISRAASMFSPEDLNAILKAIHEYNHCSKKVNEIEEEEYEAADKLAEE